MDIKLQYLVLIVYFITITVKKKKQAFIGKIKEDNDFSKNKPNHNLFY